MRETSAEPDDVWCASEYHHCFSLIAVRLLSASAAAGAPKRTSIRERRAAHPHLRKNADPAASITQLLAIRLPRQPSRQMIPAPVRLVSAESFTLATGTSITSMLPGDNSQHPTNAPRSRR